MLFYAVINHGVIHPFDTLGYYYILLLQCINTHERKHRENTENCHVSPRVHNIKREESVLLQYSLYKCESQSYDAIPIVTFNVLVGQACT